jgi:hypothetical protein
MNRMIIGSLVLAAAAPAFAGDTFIVTRGDQMYRYDGNAVDQFTLNDTLHSLSNTDMGIIGVSNLQSNVGDPPPMFETWRLDGAQSNAPTLTQIGTMVDQRFTTVTQVGETLYGLGEGFVYTVDSASSFTQMAVIDPGEAIGGSGYDAASGNFYVTGPNSDSFFTLNLGTGARTLIGALGFDFRNQGGEWWDGQYWAALEDVTNDRLVLGTVDTTTGLFSLEVVLQDGLGNLGSNQTMGLAIIPSPSSLALLGLGGLAATRRRR